MAYLLIILITIKVQIQNYADLLLGGIKSSHTDNEETVCNQCKVKYNLQS